MKSWWTLTSQTWDLAVLQQHLTCNSRVLSQKKSPRKSGPCCFWDAKGNHSPSKSTTTMIRHVLELLDLTGLRRNIRKINSKAKPGMRHQSTFGKKLLVSVALLLWRKNMWKIHRSSIFVSKSFSNLATGSQWVNVAKCWSTITSKSSHKKQRIN